MKTIQNKSKGTEVKILQTYLKVAVDGIFGPKTAAAVNNWKIAHGINPDGIFTESDWNVLAQTLPSITEGSRGIEVKMWQLFLGISADGIFGPKTKASTRSYQSTANLTIDGVVGKQTWCVALGNGVSITVNAVPSASNTPGQKNLKPIDYKQYDSRWGSVVYTRNNTYNKKQTIKSSGCGPTAMSDIVATWWDKNVTPKILAALSVEKGYRTTNSGTAWGFFKFCAEKYGASKFVQTSSYATAEAALKNGAYVVCSMGPGLYTSAGHYICWWWTDGTYNYVNDPASASSARAKSKVNIIKTQAKQFFIFYK